VTPLDFVFGCVAVALVLAAWSVVLTWTREP